MHKPCVVVSIFYSDNGFSFHKLSKDIACLIRESTKQGVCRIRKANEVCKTADGKTIINVIGLIVTTYDCLDTITREQLVKGLCKWESVGGKALQISTYSPQQGERTVDVCRKLREGGYKD